MKRELTAHWGLSGVFAYDRQLSPVDLGSYASGWAPDGVSGVGSPGGQFKNDNGGVAAFLVTYDPFTNPGGFRMPVSLGPFYGWQGLDFVNNISATDTESVNYRRSFAGVMGNISLDFLLFHDLRVIPGLLIFQGFASREAPYTYVVDNNGTITNYPLKLTAAPSGGDPYVQFLWRPWNVAATASLLSGSEVYALTWSHKWSGAGAATMLAQAQEKAKKEAHNPTLTSRAFEAGSAGAGFDPYLELDPVTVGLGGSSGNSYSGC